MAAVLVEELAFADASCTKAARFDVGVMEANPLSHCDWEILCNPQSRILMEEEADIGLEGGVRAYNPATNVVQDGSYSRRR